MALIDAASYIKQYLDLKWVISPRKWVKRGRSLMCSCPLHKDSKPSLAVDEGKQIWHCFSCGKGGDAITFVMAKDSLGFREACRKLIRDYSIPPPSRLIRDEELREIKKLETSGNTSAAIALLAKRNGKHNS